MNRHADTRSRRAASPPTDSPRRMPLPSHPEVPRRKLRKYFGAWRATISRLKMKPPVLRITPAARAYQQRPSVCQFDRERAASQHIGHAGRWILHLIGPAAEPSMSLGGAAVGFELPQFCSEHCAAFAVDHQPPH